MKKLTKLKGITSFQINYNLKMKLSALFLIVSIFTLQANESYSQKKKISLDFDHIPLETVLDKIESLSKFKFTYNDRDVNYKRIVSVNFNKETIHSILLDLFDDTNVVFEVFKKQIILTVDNNINRVPDPPKIEIEKQQDIEIKGIVNDEQGNPLPGASILVKGTTKGTGTDFDGNFSLNVEDKNATLVVSFIGYITQEVGLNGASTIRVDLVVDASQLEEVVLIGYGTQKKSNLTAAVEMVDTKVLENRPVRTLGEMLVGEVSGLNVSINSGAPDATPSFNIRGFTGINSSAQPLILIDGVEQNINLINASDVENISVLKDAAASAIYGSRAPFGVILITTKSGKRGQAMQVNYSGRVVVDKPTYIWPILNSLDWVNDINNGRYNSQQGPLYSDATIQGIIANRDGTGEVNVRRPDPDNRWDWHWGATNYTQNRLDLAYRDKAVSNFHDLNVQGGSEKTNYYVGLGYNKKQGIYQSDVDFSKNYSMIAKINTDISDKITIRTNMRYSRQDATRPNYRSGSSSQTDSSILGNGNLYYFPNVPSINPDGNYHWLSIIPAIKGLTGTFNNEASDVFLSGGFDYKPIEGLTIVGDLSYIENSTFSKRDGKWFQTDWGNGFLSPTGRSDRFDEVYESFSKTQGHNISLVATYEKEINKHNFLVMGGYQQEARKFNRLIGSNRDLYSQDVMSLSTSYGDNPFVDDVIWHWATEGYFFRASYNYDGKYLLDFNSRYDAASKYAPESRWAYFPSVSVGYNIAKENFWNIEKINALKITGSWGKLGDQAGGNYLYIPTLGTNAQTPYILGDNRVPYVTQASLVSSELTWAKPRTIGVGLEVGAFNNRLQSEYRWYQRTTFDQTGPPDTYPEVLGTNPPLSNNAVTETRGWELSLSWKDKAFDIKGAPLRYNVRAVLSDYVGYVVEYPSNITGSRSGWTPGEEFGVLYGYKGQEVIRDPQQLQTDLLWRGGWNYTGSTTIPDVNGDGRINSGDGGFWYSQGDRANLGYTYPRYKYSIRAGANWENFNLSIFLDGVGKQVYYSSGAAFIGNSTGGAISHALQMHHDLGYYSENNQDAFYPRTFYSGGSGVQSSDTYMINLAHLRIKNVNLSYSLPQEVLDKLKLRSLIFNLSGENLGFVYNKSRLNMDPIQVQQGGRTYPILQTYSFGMNIGL